MTRGLVIRLENALTRGEPNPASQHVTARHSRYRRLIALTIAATVSEVAVAVAVVAVVLIR